MSDPARNWLLSTSLLLGCVFVLAEHLGAQQGDPPSQEDAGPLAALSQPATWSVEPEETPAIAMIVEGTTLYLEPDPESQILALLPESQLPLIESRAPWAKVLYGDRLGWVDLETPRRSLGGNVTRTREEILESESFRLPVAKWYSDTWGPYQLFSLVYDRLLLEYLAVAAEAHGELYSERFGLHPKQSIYGSVVFIPGETFQLFMHKRQVENAGYAYLLKPEIVFMRPGKKSKRQLAAVMIHELTHLLNWQILREEGTTQTPLPAWLDDGMADDLALSLRVRKGHVAAESLAPDQLYYDRQLDNIVHRLVADLAAGGSGYVPTLSQLMTMTPATFSGAQHQRHHVLSALWVRYLLSGAGEDIANRFRGYLATMVGGGSPHPDELATQLDLELPPLESDFRVWLTQQQASLGR